jgi:hypothetical protein
VVEQSFHGVLLGSQVFFFVPGRSWRHCFTARLYLDAKPAHVRVDVGGLAYHLHNPTACSRQTRGQGLLLDTMLFHCCSGQWHLSGGY